MFRILGALESKPHHNLYNQILTRGFRAGVHDGRAQTQRE